MYSPDALYKLTDLPLQEEDFENNEEVVQDGTLLTQKSETGISRPQSATSKMTQKSLISTGLRSKREAVDEKKNDTTRRNSKRP